MIETPCLRILFGPRPETFVPLVALPEADERAPLRRDTSATRLCTRCNGVGRTKRSRERSAATERNQAARSAARNRCRACGGCGYVCLDARPGPEAHAATYELPDVSPSELARNRARRYLTHAARAIGRAWYDARAIGPDGRRLVETGYTPLWPLTQSGVWAWITRERPQYGVHRARVLSQADAEARALLVGAEAEARAACAMAGIATPETVQIRPVGSTVTDTLYMGDDFS